MVLYNAPLSPSQEEIHQAKKDWELSHLQQLREQEEKMAREEEEKEEAMCLTYDRPEMINKVVFRRNKTTGTWEVLVPNAPPSDQASQSTNNSKVHKNVNKKRKNEKCNTASRVSTRLSSEEAEPQLGEESQVCHTPSSSGNPKRATIAHANSLEDPDYSPSDVSHQGRRTRSRNNLTQVATTTSPKISPNAKNSLVPDRCRGSPILSPSSVGDTVPDDVMVLRSRSPATIQSSMNCNSSNDVSSLTNNHLDPSGGLKTTSSKQLLGDKC